jgi:hypothetical protein
MNKKTYEHGGLKLHVVKRFMKRKLFYGEYMGIICDLQTWECWHKNNGVLIAEKGFSDTWKAPFNEMKKGV